MGEGHVMSREEEEEEDFPSPALRHRHGLQRKAVSLGGLCCLFCFFSGFGINKFLSKQTHVVTYKLYSVWDEGVKQAVELTLLLNHTILLSSAETVNMNYVLEQSYLCNATFSAVVVCSCVCVSSCFHFPGRHKPSLSSLLLDKAIQCTFTLLFGFFTTVKHSFCCIIWKGEGTENSLRALSLPLVAVCSRRQPGTV